MNSIRYAVLALLMAFSGSQVSAMESLSSSQRALVETASVLSGEEAIALANEVSKDLATTEEGKNILQRALEYAHSTAYVGSVISFGSEFVKAHPTATKALGITAVATATGVVVCLAYKNNVHKTAFVKLGEVKNGIFKAVKAHPYITGLALTGLALVALKALHNAGKTPLFVEPVFKFASSVSETLSNWYSKMPSISQYVPAGLLGFGGAVTAYGIGSQVKQLTFGSATEAKETEDKKETSKQAPAKVTVPAPKKAEAPAQKPAVNNNNNQPGYFERARNAAFGPNKAKEEANRLAALNLAKQELVTILQAELNGTTAIGTAKAFAAKNFPAVVALIETFDNTISRLNTAQQLGHKRKYTAEAKEILNQILAKLQ